MVLVRTWACSGASTSTSGTRISALSVAKYMGGSPPDTFCAGLAGLGKMMTMRRVRIKTKVFVVDSCFSDLHADGICQAH